jgi:hypothetical protein
MSAEFPEQEWPPQNGRVEFHMNGGITKVSLWAGGLQRFDIKTDSIPPELRTIGTWLKMKLNSRTGWIVEGLGEPCPFIEQWLAGNPRPQSEF